MTISKMASHMLLLLSLPFLLINVTTAFVPRLVLHAPLSPRGMVVVPISHDHGRLTGSSWGMNNRIVRLSMAKIDIQTPSPEDAASMGIRDWPQQVKSGAWSEFVAEDKTVIRYVLDGTGSVDIVDEDIAETKFVTVGPGTFIEVTGPVTLKWMVNSNNNNNNNQEMILLTPGFEENGLFAGVAVAVIALFGFLIVGTGSL